MKKMKKIAALMLATVMSTSLVGCGGNKKTQGQTPHNGGKEVEISYWNGGQGTEYLDAMIKAFNEKQSDWYVFYKATADASTAKTTYTVDYQNTVDIYMNTTIFDHSKMIPLDDLLDSTADGDTKTLREKFNATYLEEEKAADGHIYSLTWGGGVVGIVYNKVLFEKAGIKELPRTTDELTAVCDKLLAANISPIISYKGEGYWNYIENVWQSQYDGIDYYNNNFYACKDENGKSPSLDVFTKKDGRYQVLKAMEKFITPEYVYSGSNSHDHITMQTLFLNQDIGMMANGAWLSNEMEGTGSTENFGVMKTPVISGITDKLTTVKGDTALRKLISAIDSVVDGKASITDYQSGDGYVVDGKTVSAADWDFVKSARCTVANQYPAQTLFIPSYSEEIEGAKEFLKFYYSDEGIQIIAKYLHVNLPMELCEGEIDTSDWNSFDVEMYNLYKTSDNCVCHWKRSAHDIFNNGGASAYGGYKFVELFCANNPADRVTAEQAWDTIVKKIKGNYDGWVENIK